MGPPPDIDQPFSSYRLVQGAWVHESARLPEDPRDIVLEPGAFIGPNVELGPGTWVGTGAVIRGPARLGEKNQIFPHAVLGGPPQDLSYAGQPTRLEIGDRNVFREHVTVSRASAKADGVTRVGNDNFFMAGAHVGHDCIIEDKVILANGVLLGGHVHIGSSANIAGGCSIVQFVTLGRFCFIGGNSGVRKDLEPYISHNWSHRTLGEAGPACINEVGLRRNGFSAETIQNLRTAFKVIFLRKEPFNEFGREARLEIESRGASCPEVEELLTFCERKRASRFGRHRG